MLAALGGPWAERWWCAHRKTPTCELAAVQCVARQVGALLMDGKAACLVLTVSCPELVALGSGPCWKLFSLGLPWPSPGEFG